MKITRSSRQNKLSWDFVEVGETFIENHNGPVYLKIADVFDSNADERYNAVNLQTGDLVDFSTTCAVIVVKSELLIQE